MDIGHKRAPECPGHSLEKLPTSRFTCLAAIDKASSAYCGSPQAFLRSGAQSQEVLELVGMYPERMGGGRLELIPV